MFNLPLILDIAIGLVFIYITLSLVASEIQELLSTLLQWRAKHLKTSIKYLLMGSEIDSVDEIKQTKQLIDELYSNPLIKNLNHQAQGKISYWWQKNNIFNDLSPQNINIEDLKNKLIEEVGKIEKFEEGQNSDDENDKKIFKEFKKELEIITEQFKSKKSAEIVRLKFKEEFNKLLINKIGDTDKSTRHKLIEIREEILDNSPLPSYIPGDTFATTLLEVLRIPSLNHYLSCNKLKGFIKRLVDKLSEIENIAQKDSNVKILTNFITELKEIYDNFCDKKYTLEISLLRIKGKLNELIIIFENTDDEQKRMLAEKLKNIQDTFFEEKNFEILCQEMKLNLVYVSKILDPNLDEKEKHKILEETDNDPKEEWTNKDIFGKVENPFKNDNTESQRVQKEIQYILGKLPKTLKDSIVTLANRAETKIDNTQQDIEQLSEEIEIWFNNSMERASGVYKRNSKGLALIISFIIAFVANADSFHMVSRLSKDSILRDALVKSSITLEQSCDSDDPFDCIKSTTEQNLEQLSLPIGWSCVNLEQQTGINFIPLPFFDWRLCANKNNDLIKEQPQQVIKNNVSDTKPEQVAENNISAEQTEPVIVNSISEEQEQPEKEFNTGVLLLKIFRTLFGYIISAIAISMGASFWFDVLGKIVNVRNTGMKPTSKVKETTKSSKAS